MEMAKVTSKGQITIPVSIRRRLSIMEGDKLLFIDSPEGVVMVNPDKIPAAHDSESRLGEDSPQQAGAQKPRNNTAAQTTQGTVAPGEIRGSSQTQRATTSTPPQPLAAAGTRDKQEPLVKGLDVGALLDEIRSIGSNTLK